MLKQIQWLLSKEGFTRRLGPVVGPFNPWLAEHRQDPYPTWRRLRAESPVCYSRGLGAWILTRYDDCNAVLRDPNFTTDRNQTGLVRALRFIGRKNLDFIALLDGNLLMLDGAEHRRLRGLVSKAFTPRRISGLRPQIEALVDELLDEAAEEGEVDFVSRIAHRVPVAVIAELLGVPQEDREDFLRWSSGIVQMLDPLQGSGGAAPMMDALRELNAYFRPLLAARRKSPRDDLLSAMIAAEEDGSKLAEADLLALSSLLLVAGHETTSNLLGNAVVALLENPGERKRLTDDLALLPSAIDEFLRFDSPIQLTDRAVIADCEVGGQSIKAGQLVGLVLAAANRDPAKFENPDALDVGRGDNHHLAFGLGNHFCLGSQLARLEAEVVLGALLRRFPDFEGPRSPVERHRSLLLRGPVSLPLRLVPE
jgi:pimeloyl-[acyl-carrier protein] synthase